MQEQQLNIRIRDPLGKVNQIQISSSKLVNDLVKLISNFTNIPVEQIVMKSGYPLKILNQHSKNALIYELNLENGDQIIVEQDKTQQIKEQEVIHKNQSKPIKEQEVNPKQQPSDQQQLVNDQGLIMIRRVIPANNSCLFLSIAYALENKSKDQKTVQKLRQIVSDKIAKFPELYTQAFLEKSNKEYQQWILKDTSWGGFIELDILAQYYKIEIITVSIETCQIIKFGSNIKQDKCIYLLYDGIHYDIICCNIAEDFDEEYDQTEFLKNDSFALQGALALAAELKKKKAFTNVSNFNLQCGICFQGFVGQNEALQHGQKTGHMNFQEVKK